MPPQAGPRPAWNRLDAPAGRSPTGFELPRCSYKPVSDRVRTASMPFKPVSDRVRTASMPPTNMPRPPHFGKSGSVHFHCESASGVSLCPSGGHTREVLGWHRPRRTFCRISTSANPTALRQKRVRDGLLDFSQYQGRIDKIVLAGDILDAILAEGETNINSLHQCHRRLGRSPRFRVWLRPVDKLDGCATTKFVCIPRKHDVAEPFSSWISDLVVGVTAPRPRCHAIFVAARHHVSLHGNHPAHYPSPIFTGTPTRTATGV